jgi:hypothetical protein
MRLEVRQRQLLEVREEVVRMSYSMSREAPIRIRRARNWNVPPSTPIASSSAP